MQYKPFSIQFPLPIQLFLLVLLAAGPAQALDIFPEPVSWEGFRVADVAPDDAAQFNGDSFTPAAGETVYYVSSSAGSDANDGLSPSNPWDLATFNAHRANDSIYLFKRGDVFRGGIERKMSKVNTKFGAYGSGTRPLFLGSLEIDGWQVTSDTRVPADVRGQVYEANLAAMVFGGSNNDNGIRHLFVDGQLMTIARYPNVASPDQVNWLNISEKRDTYSFYDAHLPDYNNTNGYWSGANLRARTYSWQYSVRQVTGYADGVITTESVSTPWYPIKGWGYFLDNKLEELDHPGEWYYDAAAQRLFLYPPDGVNIHASRIEGATHDTGINIYWQQDDVQVKDLAFKHFLGNCININSSDNVIIENLVTQYCRQGLYMWDSNATRIRDNHFDQSLETGINISKHTDIVVSGNTITNNGMFPTYGSFNTPLTQGKGINSLNSGALTLRGNRIINSAYSGIEIGTDEAVVERNLILGSLLHINDGGAITLRGSGIQLSENLIIGVYGNINDGANGYTGNDKTSKHTTYGMGIFDYSGEQNNTIHGNSVAYARDIGIMLDAGDQYQVSENVAYGNEVQVQAKSGGDGIGITDNTLFVGDNIVPGGGKIAAHKGLQITGDHTNLTIDRNQYGAYSSESYIVYDGSFDLDAFLHFNGLHDLNASSYYLQRPKYAVESVTATLLHEDFEDCQNPDQWNNTSAISGGECSDDTSKTGSRSLVKRDATAAPTFFQFKDPVTFTQGKVYNLEFDSYASGKTLYELTIADFIDEEWTRQIAEYSFQLDSQRRHHQLMFTAWIDMTQQPILHVRAGESESAWIDNVVLQEVAIEPKQKTSVLFGETGLQQVVSDTALLINDQWTEQRMTLPLGYETLDGQGGAITLPPFRSRVLVRTPSSCVSGPATLATGVHRQTAHYQSATTLATQGDTRIAADADVTLTAAQGITLNPGFHAEAQSRFVARISGVSCGN